MENETIKKQVREAYGAIAENRGSCCEPGVSCGTEAPVTKEQSKLIGYSDEDLSSVPEGANMGLGCGNPLAFESLREGDTVLDLGAGAGFDCFIAANKVGKTGKVIGVDMTPAMIDRARENARKDNYENVEFRLGEIENIPAADNSVDVVISNCVISLSPDKKRVYSEAHRVLKPGGKLMVSDLVTTKVLPEIIKGSIDAYIGCMAGATMIDEYLGIVKRAGFPEITITKKTTFPIEFIMENETARQIIEDLDLPDEMVKDIADSFVGIGILTKKPTS